MMRQLDASGFEALGPGDITIIDEKRILDQIALFAFLHKTAIEDELRVVYGDGSAPNWILDLSTTSLFSILSELAESHSTIEVYCDESKPLLANWL